MLEHQPPESGQTGRRDFIVALAKWSTLFATGNVVANAQEPASENNLSGGVLPQVSGEPVAGHSPESGLSETLSKINLYSAHAVSTGFLGALGHAVLCNQGQLSLHYAAVVNSLEAARLVALSLGDASDRGHALKEMKDLFRDSLPALIMIAASDFAERGIALEPSVIAARLSPRNEYHPAEDERLARERPAIGASGLDEWEAHRATVTGRISDRVAQMVAITSIAAPCATTLTAAAFWKDGFDDVAHLCMELSFARRVTDCLKRGADPAHHETELKALAAVDSTELLNGPWGYNQLGIALACNAQGLFGVGTPPNIWFASKHLASDPLGCAKSEAKGFLLSETQTLLATGIWLSRCTGLGIFETCQKLITNQYKTIGLIRESFSEAELRSTSVGDGNRLVSRLLPILHRAYRADAIDEVVRDIRKEVLATPTPAFQLSLGEWLERMGSVYERIARRFPLVRDRIGNIPDLSAEELDDISELKGSEFYDSLVKALESGGHGAVHGHLEKYQRWRQNRLAQRIAVVLHSIAGEQGQHDGDLDDFIKGFGLTSEMQFGRDTFQVLKSESERAVTSELNVLSRTLQQVASFGSEKERLKSAEKLSTEGVEPDTILRQLGYVHRDTLKQACDMLVNIGVPLENVMEFLKVPAGAAAGSGGSTDPSGGQSAGSLTLRLLHWLEDSWEDPRNLSESTRDIIRVIATQLPAIPAFAISLTELLKEFAQVDKDTKVTHGQLSLMLKVLPAFGFGVAALADNVPGYLILQEVTTGLFEQTFGHQVVEQVPHLKSRIGFISKIIASQSGMAFPFSSATNLLQDKVEVVPTDDAQYPQGFGIKRTKLSTSDTTSSWYMRVAAGSTIAWATMELLQLFSQARLKEQQLASSAQ